MKLDPAMDAAFQADMKKAITIAIKAEDRACQAINDTIVDECNTPELRVLVTAIVTAAMVTKFTLAKLAMPNDNWGRAVDDLVAQMTPMATEEALDVRFGQQA